jgi:nitroreductase
MSTDAGDDLAQLFQSRFGRNEPAPRVDPADVEKLRSILEHRTHRRYSAETVTPETLRLLLAATFSTPAKSDLQQCSVIVIRSDTQRQRLADLIPSMPWIAAAPVFVVFCGDSRRIRRACDVRGIPFANDHLDAFLNAAADAAMHLSTFVNAADALGLGTCPISVLRNHVEQVCEILELPDGVFPLAGCSLGWPERQGYVSMRLPLSLTVHEDKYDDEKFESLLGQYDHDRHAGYQIPEASHRYNDDYGEAEFYGWSEDKARQVSKPERQGLGDFLRRHGFRFD